MTRRLFGGDSAVQDELGNVFSNQTNVGNVWTAASGGSAVIDLQTPQGGAISSVSTDSHGMFSFFGPDGVSKLYIDFGFGRFLILATDITDRLDAIEAGYLSVTSLGQPGGFPGPLDDNGDLPITEIPGIGQNEGIAALGADGFIDDTANNSFLPYVAVPDSGTIRTRQFYTGDATRCVIWRTATDPGINSTYALRGVDMWVDATGALWIAGTDGQWHGGGGSGPTLPPITVTMVTQANMTAAATTGGGSTGVLFGASPGGNGNTRMTAMVATVNPNFVRTFESTPATFGGNTQGQYVPSGTPQCNSVKPDIATMGNSGSAGYSAMVTAYRAYFAAMPDIPGQRACLHHEPEGDDVNQTVFTYAQYRQSQINFANAVIGNVNGSRTNPIKPITILQAYTLQSASNRDITNWIDDAVIAALLANGGEVGFDIYNAAQIALASAYSTAHSIPWAIPEYGFSSSTTGTDAQLKSFMTANSPGLKTMSNPPTFVCWFDSLENMLNTFLATGSSVGATTLTVDSLPGHTAAKDLPNGSAVRVDTGGTVDAVTTNADSAGNQNGPGNPNLTLHVPALAHAHSANAVIEIKPLAAAQWKVYCA